METTKDQTSSGGTTSGGANGGADDKNQTVSYDTHRRLLAEKKEVSERLKKLEEERESLLKEKEDKEKAELERKGEIQKLLELERERAKKAEDRLNSIQSDLENAKKRNAVLKHIAGTVPEPARDWIKVDGISLKEDGSVDDESAKLVAQQFEQNFSFAVLKQNTNGGLPNDAAKGGASGGGKLTVSQWKALKSSKEMKARMADVDWNTN